MVAEAGAGRKQCGRTNNVATSGEKARADEMIREYVRLLPRWETPPMLDTHTHTDTERRRGTQRENREKQVSLV